MKVGVGFDGGRVRAQRLAALHEHRFECVQIGTGAIRHGFVQERPEPFGWLEFRRAWGQAHHIDPGRDRERAAGVPAGTIQH